MFVRGSVLVFAVCVVFFALEADAETTSVLPTDAGERFLRRFVAHDCSAVMPLVSEDFFWTQPALDKDGRVIAVNVNKSTLFKFCQGAEGGLNTNFTVHETVNDRNGKGVALSGRMTLHTADSVLSPSGVVCIYGIPNPWTVKLEEGTGLIKTLDESIDLYWGTAAIAAKCNITAAAQLWYRARAQSTTPTPPLSLSITREQASVYYSPDFPAPDDPRVTTCLAPIRAFMAQQCNDILPHLSADFTYIEANGQTATAAQLQRQCANLSVVSDAVYIVGGASAQDNTVQLQGTVLRAVVNPSTKQPCVTAIPQGVRCELSGGSAANDSSLTVARLSVVEELDSLYQQFAKCNFVPPA